MHGAGIMVGIKDACDKHNLALHDLFHATVGSSAGAFNLAYLHAGNPELGASIYLDLCKGFIRPERLLRTMMANIRRNFLGTCTHNQDDNVVNIDLLVDMARNTKPLDTETLRSQQVPLYFELLSRKTGNVELVDARQVSDVHAALQSAVTCEPFYLPQEKGPFVDAGIKESVGLDRMLKTYEDRKIVLLLNAAIRRSRTLTNDASNVFYACMSMITGNPQYARHFLSKPASLARVVDMVKARKTQVLVISPSEKSCLKFGTTDPNILQRAFEEGKSRVPEILQFLGHTAS